MGDEAVWWEAGVQPFACRVVLVLVLVISRCLVSRNLLVVTFYLCVIVVLFKAVLLGL